MRAFGLSPLILFASGVLLAQATPTAQSDLPPVVWELVGFIGADGIPVEIVDPTRYTVQFLPEGRLTAKLDCNQGSGGYSAAGGVLAITQMVNTLRFCAAGSRGTIFARLLQPTTSYRFDPDGFLLLRGDAGVLRLQPALRGVQWQWQADIGREGEVMRPDQPAHYTVEFLPEGKLAIRADCNRAVGAYSVTGAAIDLTIGGISRRLCPPGTLMDRFLGDLDEVVSHVFQRGHLALGLAGGRGVMEFAPVYAPPAEATPVAG